MHYDETASGETAESPHGTQCTAFCGQQRIASGSLAEVALKAKARIAKRGHEPILIFNDASGQIIEVDFRGTDADVEKRLRPPEAQAVEKRGPGRPKLGVVGREVTLLPRHWEWLDDQPGGASVALRKLVERGRRANREIDRARASRDAAYRFMSALAGNLSGFEEASRAFFAGNQDEFVRLTKGWPKDIREHARKLAEVAFRDRSSAQAS